MQQIFEKIKCENDVDAKTALNREFSRLTKVTILARSREVK